MKRMIRISLPALLSALVLTSLASTATTAATPTATAAANCSILQHGQHLGPTYLTALSVSGTSCGSGLSVVRAYHNCQLKHGGVRSKCTSSVNGFHCIEKRGPSIPTEFFSNVSCKRSSARVVYKYTQFT